MRRLLVAGLGILAIAAVSFWFSSRNEKVPSRARKSHEGAGQNPEKIMAAQTPAYEPQSGDLSPEGFNWVHRDLALIFSGAVYEHGFEGVVREKKMGERRAELTAYLETLRKIRKAEFAKWDEKNRLSFLINAYHAHLLVLSIEHGFQGLDDALLDRPGTVRLFENEYSLSGLVRAEILPGNRDPRVVLALRCFSAGCPEYRNTIYNFRNLDEMLQTSAFRFFLDETKNKYDTATRTLALSPYLLRYRDSFPRQDRELQKFLAPFFAEGQTAVAELLKTGRARLEFKLDALEPQGTGKR